MKICLVLIELCYECYLVCEGVVSGGFVLDSLEGWWSGGDLGLVIVLGEVDSSLFMVVICYELVEMLLDGWFDDFVIRDFVCWIENGVVDLCFEIEVEVMIDGSEELLVLDVELWLFELIDLLIFLGMVYLMCCE